VEEIFWSNPYENVKIVEHNACLQYFLTKYVECCSRECTRYKSGDVDELWEQCVVEECDWLRGASDSNIQSTNWSNCCLLESTPCLKRRPTSDLL